MDLGCFDMGCIETQKKDSSTENESGSSYSSNESVMATYKIGKNKATKEVGQSNLSTTLNKCTSQIRKPPRRRTSPLSWFPRKKMDSYLQRKIKLLQEVDGMKSTLDETLGDSNPHYSKVLKEKMAAREAATKAMETRKAAMVEASWCRILQAARIECKDAEAQRLEAEKTAREAIEAATSHGVIMYDTPDCPQKYYKIQTSATKDAVAASFETAFEVDKQVAYAVKTALTKLAQCLSTNKDDFRELLRRISQNPDSDGNSQGCSEFSSECESDTASEFELGSHENGPDPLNHNPEAFKEKQKDNRNPAGSGKYSSIDLVEMMLERLKCLQEDELASLATIVATCGLNAALDEGLSHEKNENGSLNKCNLDLVIGAGNDKVRRNSITNAQTRRAEVELPSLEKFLVKRLTRLEREVLEAKNARKSEGKDINQQSLDKSNEKKLNPADNTSSDFERGNTAPVAYGKDNASVLPSLDKFLVKHVSRLEKEVQDAKSRRNLKPVEGSRVNMTVAATCVIGSEGQEKENVDLDKNVHAENDLIGKDSIQTCTSQTFLQEQSSESASDFPIRGQSLKAEELLQCKEEKLGRKEADNHHDYVKETSFRSYDRIRKQGRLNVQNGTECESLDKILVKHVSRLEKEKMGFNAKEEMITKVKKRESNRDPEESLDKVLVKHSSRLEREKMADLQPGDEIRHSVTRREAREKELQAAWGGLSLGNSIRPHVSRLQRDKAAWLKAEDEEKKRAVEKD